MANQVNLVSKQNIERALNVLSKENSRTSNSTRYSILYEGKLFPPKDTVRRAAKIQGLDLETLPGYLKGGPSTNNYLKKLGYEIVNRKSNELIGASPEQRVARICWNDKGWVYPSGKNGKSKNKTTHEGKYGYGHEEWLYDIGKTIGGYHYGFLEPIGKQQDAYVGKKYDIWLYSINAQTKKRFWIGIIYDVEVLTHSQAAKVKQSYIKKGWFKSMVQQIKSSEANPTGFSNYKGIDLFNIKFLPQNIIINHPYVQLPDGHPVNQYSRYSFAHYKNSFDLNESPINGFAFIPPKQAKEVLPQKSKNKTRQIKEAMVEVSDLHEQISRHLLSTLRETYGYDNVTPEHPTGYGSSRIDIVVNSKKGLIFYEIKAYPDIKTSIREALGQIIEYSMWAEENRAVELIIVTQLHKDIENVKRYIDHLRKTFKIKLSYQFFDIAKTRLSEKI